MKIVVVLMMLIALGCANISLAQETSPQNPVVIMKTSMGDIVIEFYPDQAPISVANFLRYVDDGFYDGLVFHRVISKFMIQGGGLSSSMEEPKTKYAPIKNEAKNGLKNLRGTIAMARTNYPHSATSQFFINVVDNSFLDNGVRGYGYAVFGKVIKGMDVVDKIAEVKTSAAGMHQDVPIEPVTIVSVKRYLEEVKPTEK